MFKTEMNLGLRWPQLPNMPCLKDPRNVLPSGVTIPYEGSSFKEKFGWRKEYPYPVMNDYISFSTFIHDGTPDPALGHPGDVYVDIAGRMLWGKIGEHEWRAFTSMKFNTTNEQVLYHPYFPQRRILHINPKGKVVWTLSDTARGWKAEAGDDLEKAINRLIERYKPSMALESNTHSTMDMDARIPEGYSTSYGADESPSESYPVTGNAELQSSIDAVDPPQKIYMPTQSFHCNPEKLLLAAAGDESVERPSLKTAIPTLITPASSECDPRRDPPRLKAHHLRNAIHAHTPDPSTMDFAKYGISGCVALPMLPTRAGNHVVPGSPGAEDSPEEGHCQCSSASEDSEWCANSSGRFPLSYCRTEK
ncbi:hypothetical protein GLOTRDRAFT_95349 [Gloeophyllum trabeum ATCC 11539]|uniref:Uncharacterized protein n=1 Tax=Gloeophyllum trabeum (strain ATCC 11539 / FP-39264 / Madison 617) TaxID=670483 RepID=S7PY26_GLOTA|nr:uncharacterized protein GLOTRDRAFT_95349 [Gloeophyllum trabeum ATCC 11539]EPQ52423.1 hypothetical protein GLOTRDRAFT_95349 [Gloeophyllum trabeum ATCC 11539]